MRGGKAADGTPPEHKKNGVIIWSEMQKILLQKFIKCRPHIHIFARVTFPPCQIGRKLHGTVQIGFQLLSAFVGKNPENPGTKSIFIF